MNVRDAATADMLELSATDLARRIALGEISAVEAVAASIAQAEATQPSLRAIAIPLFDQALEAARRADAARQSQSPVGDLNGVPFTVKECVAVAGTDATAGVTALGGQPAAEDSPLVAAMRRAGAIPIAKTNLGQLVWTYEAANPVYGRTSNPWDLTRTPGGSSGGEAAAVAAGIAPLGIGTDSAGSVRLPAHFCGVHGLKPTSGRLTTAGTVDDVIIGGNVAVANQPGPFARCVGDLDAIMRVLLDAGGMREQSVPWRPPPKVELAGLHVGMPDDESVGTTAPAVARALRDSAALLESRGAQVVEFRPPPVGEAMCIGMALFAADGGRALEALLAGGPRDPEVALSVAQAQETGELSLTAFFDVIKQRDRYRHAFELAWTDAELDLLVCPPFPIPAPQHGVMIDLPPTYGAWQYVFNLLDWPAGVVAASRVEPGEASGPGGTATPEATWRDSEGLPVGVQVAAAPWREDLVLAAMEALEVDFRARPSYPATPVGPPARPA